ncbi:septum formation initiator [Lacticaseibacillus rhamnosus MTCC 5462]|nr:septum formation initiator [Lacticaseibacillus rhamnosus MTCC 5462]
MKRIRNLLIVMVAILGLGGVSLMRTQMTLGETNQAVAKAKSNLNKLKANKAALKVQVDQLHNDDYTAKLIRENTSIRKPGEIILICPDKSKQK